MDEKTGRRTVEDHIARMERLARETGRAMGRTVRQAEVASRQAYGAMSKEARSSARELTRHTSIVMDEARNEIPRLRAELREMGTRVRDRIR
jgi:hypothetical protein